MPPNERSLTASLVLRDLFSGPANKIKQGFGGLSKDGSAAFDRIDRSINRTISRIGAFAAGIFSLRSAIATVRAQANFEEQSAFSSTFQEGLSESFVSEAVLREAAATGSQVEKLNEGFRESARVTRSASEALTLFTQANRLAVATMEDTRGSVASVNSVLSVYELGVEDSARVAALLNDAVKRGRVDLQAFSSAFGAAAPTLREFGLSLEDTFAAVIAGARNGLDATRTLSGLRQAAVGLNRVLGPQAIRLRGGMVETLRQIVEESRNGGRSLKEFGIEGESIGAVLSVVADGGNRFREALESLPGAVQRFNRDFEKLNSTTNSFIGSVKALGNTFVSELIGVQSFTDELGKIASSEEAFRIIQLAANRLGGFFSSEVVPIVKLIGVEFRFLWDLGVAAFEGIKRAANEAAILIEAGFLRAIASVLRTFEDMRQRVNALFGGFNALPDVGIGLFAAGIDVAADKALESLGSAKLSILEIGRDIDRAFRLENARVDTLRSESRRARAETEARERQIIASSFESIFGTPFPGGAQPADTPENDQRIPAATNLLTINREITDVIREGVAAQQQSGVLYQDINQLLAEQERIQQGIASFSDRIASTLANTFQAMADGAITAKEALADLARQLTNTLLQRGLSGLLNLGISGIGSAFPGFASLFARGNGGVIPGSFKAFASGGISNGPTLGLIGEGRFPREAVIPLPDGRSVPVNLRGSGGSNGGGVVIMNVTTPDREGVRRFLSSQEAQDAISSAVRAARMQGR